MIHQDKTYSKKLLKMDLLGKNDQVFVISGKNIVGQYFCFNSKCSISYCEECFKNESGYLVFHNNSLLRYYDAFLNGLSNPFLWNFTLDEEDVSSSSTTAAVTDVPLISSITPTESLHLTEMPEKRTEGEPYTGVKVAIAIIALLVLVALVAIAIDVVTARKAGRDAIIFRVIRCRRRDPEPNQQEENEEMHIQEMRVFMPNQEEL